VFDYGRSSGRADLFRSQREAIHERGSSDHCVTEITVAVGAGSRDARALARRSASRLLNGSSISTEAAPVPRHAARSHRQKFGSNAWLRQQALHVKRISPTS
jgi:hypothetical protein